MTQGNVSDNNQELLKSIAENIQVFFGRQRLYL